MCNSLVEHEEKMDVPEEYTKVIKYACTKQPDPSEDK